MFVSNKFILINSVCLCIILIAQTVAIEKKNLKPHFVVEVNGGDGDEDSLNDIKCGKGFFSRISYIEKIPKSLSNEKYAENILNLENSLDLPTEFKSNKTEILDYLNTKDNTKKQKRQIPDWYNNDYERQNYDVIITVTVYGKEQDVIIIKEVIPDNTFDRDRYNVETEAPSTTTTASPSAIRYRQPDYTVIENWYPTLRTVHVHSSNMEYDQHPTEMTTTTSTTSRSFDWSGWGWNSRPSHVTPSPTTTSTTSRSSIWDLRGYSIEASSETDYEPETPTTTTTTSTTSRPSIWNLREYSTETSSETDYEPETISSTPKSQSPWGWGLFSQDKSTTTTIESSETNYEYQTNSSSPVYDYWDTTTQPSTTTTSTMKTLSFGWPFGPFSDRTDSTSEKSTTTTENYDSFWDNTTPSTTTTTTTTTTTESSADLTTTTKKFSFFNIFG